MNNSINAQVRLEVERESQLDLSPNLEVDGIPFSLLPHLHACVPACFAMITAYYNQLNEEWKYWGVTGSFDLVGATFFGDPDDQIVMGYGLSQFGVKNLAEKTGYGCALIDDADPTVIVEVLRANVPVLLFVGSRKKENRTPVLLRNCPNPFWYVAGEHSIVVNGYIPSLDRFHVQDPLHARNHWYTGEELVDVTYIDGIHPSSNQRLSLLNGYAALIYPLGSEYEKALVEQGFILKEEES